MNPPLRVYVAARYSRREEMADFATRIKLAGGIVTSCWLDGRHDDAPPQRCAEDDLDDIDRADGILSFTEDPSEYMSGGRHVEFGYALARGKWLWIVGPLENVFHHLGRVRQYPDFETWAREMLIAPPLKEMSQ